MNLSTRVGLLAGASATMLSGAAMAGSPMGDQNVEARIAELEAEVARLRGDSWLTEQRTEEIRGIVQDVLADADTRSSLLQSGMTAGYDNGVVIGSSDGNFKVKVNGQMQVRFNLSDKDSVDTSRWSWENRRTKLIFSGHVVDPSWNFKVQGAFNANGGGFGLEDAWIKKSMDNGAFVKVGQFKAPWLREEAVGSGHQLAVERSLVNEYFNQGRSQGLMYGVAGDSWRGAVAWTDGFGSANTSAQALDTEMSLSARAEFLLSGNWKQFDDFSSWQGSEYGCMVGVAARYEKGEFGTAATESETTGITIDASIEGDGWNVFAALIWENVEPTPGATDTDEMGIVLQGGYFFTEDLEGFARYEWGDLDTAADDLGILTVGVNKYFSKHGVKWTTDIGYGVEMVDAGWGAPDASTGWYADGADEDGQILIRTQLQLLW